MFPEAVSRTALLTAAARAAESRRPAPLFVDPYAELLAGEAGEELHRARDGGHPHAPGSTSDIRTATLAIRTRVFDDAILAAVTGGARQVVMPAAGMDTRAYRLELPADVRWFEIDHAAVLDEKARLLAHVTPRVARSAVPFDLRDAGVEAALAASGFDARAPTVVVVEGLLMYLAPEDVAPLLRTFAALSPAGSRLFCDIPNNAAIDPSGVLGPHLARLAAMGAPWRFATDEPARVLSPAGWNVDDVLFAGHPRAWPERLPWRAPSPLPPGYPVTWLVHATRAS